MDKEIKLKILEELMSAMDSSVGKRLKPKEMGEDQEVEVTSIEKKEMPIGDVKEMVKEKMMGADLESDDMEMELESEDDDSEDMAMEGEEMEDDTYADEPGISAFEKKLNALKRKKLSKEV